MKPFGTLTVVALLSVAPVSAPAQQMGEFTAFTAFGSQMSKFDEEFPQWQKGATGVDGKPFDSIRQVDAERSTALQELSETVAAFIKEKNAGSARFRGQDGTVIDFHLREDGGLMYNNVSWSQEGFFSDQLNSEVTEISGDFRILNTGDIQDSFNTLNVILTTDIVAEIEALSAEQVAPATPAWSTVAIYANRSDDALHCTGVAVSPKTVISAAHCFCRDIDTPQHFHVQVKPQHRGIAEHEDDILKIRVTEFIPYKTDAKPFCENGADAEAKLDLGDIILLKLEKSIPEALKMHSRETMQIIADFVIAEVAEHEHNIWRPGQCAFRTIGFGVGPSEIDPNMLDAQTIGMRRHLAYEVLQEVYLEGEKGVKVSLFHRDNHAICPSDSGSGLFVPSKHACGHSTDGVPLALAGIASKIGLENKCFESDGNESTTLKDRPATVTRLDTPEVQAWLKLHTGNEVKLVKIVGPQEVVAGGN